eukprot:1321479-Amphidinium_carterae.1
MDHLVNIPMIEGAAQSATNGNELHLLQMVRKFNHPETGVPTYVIGVVTWSIKPSCQFFVTQKGRIKNFAKVTCGNV